MVAASKPDGYTVGYVPLGSFINNYLMYDVNYDPSRISPSSAVFRGLANQL